MDQFSELFRSTEEQVEPIKATVRGQIPTWMKGSLVRLGPGKFDLGDFVMNHWFDGYAILYKFDIQNGKVEFSKKFLQSDAYKRAVEVGRPMFTEFGTRSYPDPCKNIFSRFMSSLVPEMTDNDSINIFTLEDSIYAASESHYFRRVDIASLDTHEKVDLNKLVGVHFASSHFYQDDTGAYYTLGTGFTSGLKYHVLKIPPSISGKACEAISETSLLSSIPSRWSTNISYYHSFGMSDNYIVLIEQPLIIIGSRLVAATMTSMSLKECMDWQPEELNRFIVIEKSTGNISAEYKSEKAFFLFHHINMFEENGQLIVDVIAYDDISPIEILYLKNLRKNETLNCSKGGGRRFVLPLPTGKEQPDGCNLVIGNSKATAKKIHGIIILKPEILSEPGYELPTVNNKYFGKKYRYFYCAGAFGNHIYVNSILKVDVKTGEIKTWKENEFTYPGEVQYVAEPGATEEDSGILLTAVTDIRREHPDFLLVLDAKSFTEIARAEVTVHIPAVIHGIFVPQL